MHKSGDQLLLDGLQVDEPRLHRVASKGSDQVCIWRCMEVGRQKCASKEAARKCLLTRCRDDV